MICDTAHAMREMFDHSKNTLSKDKLEWLGNLSYHAECETGNIAAMLNTLADVIGCGNPLGTLDDSELSAVLFGLATKASNIKTLLEISREAKEQAAQSENSE